MPFKPGETSEGAMPLTPKQYLFVEAYLGAANFNATEAAKLAGYSEKTAYSIGWENLRKPEIVVQIETRLTELTMPSSEVLRRLTEHARGSLTDVLDDKGKFNLGESKRKGTDRLLKELTVTLDKANQRVSYKYKMHDAQSALEKLGRYHGLFVDKTEHSFDLSSLSDEDLQALASIRSKLIT